MSRNEPELSGQPSRLSSMGTVGDEQLSLFSPEALAQVRAEEVKWRRECLEPLTSKRAAWKKDFTTVSGMEVNPLTTPTDVAHLDFERDLAFPGEFPYTRGIHPTGYRGRLWTMRQFAGFGTRSLRMLI